MTRAYTRRGVAAAILAALPIAGLTVAAQGQTTSTTTATSGKRVNRVATPEMIQEAIQRSQARSEKLRQTGQPEQFGSEEPFTFRR
jgi:hypothetical protein